MHAVVLSAGNLFANSTRGDSVWLFSLEGTVDEVSEATALAGSGAVASRAPDTANGRILYDGACAFCHGAQGEGGHGGGLPLAASTDLAAVMQQVRGGLNTMPPFGGAFTPEEIQDVSAYVVEELPH